MARIHILEGSGVSTYTVVVHDATPVGNNVAGVPWSDCIKNAGLNTTMMTVGAGPGQISNNEQNAIAAGTTLEGVFQWDNNPAWTQAERAADLDLRATQLIAELQASLAKRLRLFGLTRP